MNGVFLLIFICFALCQTPHEQAQKLVSEMTLEEQLLMVKGVGGPYVGNVVGQPKHKIPELHLEDGPQGVADGVKDVTCWPNALSAVSTWDVDLMESYGAALADEQRKKGTNVMLGPMVNIARVPFGGRNFESMGEDPYLASQMAVRNIQGIQSKGVIGCVKHYLNNNQELDRGDISASVDERTEHEIYLPPFEAAIKFGKVGSVMCSYNRINGTHACENEGSLNRYLKGELGFEGFVMSDWGGTHSTVASANNGLDMEMPRDTYFGDALLKAVQKGDVSKERIADMAVRILTPMFAIGIMDTPQTGNLSVNVQSSEHTALAQDFAEQSTVLLKNEDNILPLSLSSGLKLAIIGDDGKKSPTATGGGSGHVICPYIRTPYDGIVDKCKQGTNRCGAITYTDSSEILEAGKAASEADVAIVFLSTESSEGHDRKTLGLGAEQDALVEYVLMKQANTVVVVHGPGAVLMPWEKKTKGIIFGWFPGQQDGDAIANVLFGEVNPAARLPLSFPKTNEDTWLKSMKQYPGIDQKTEYTEKLLVGYRYYDSENEEPLFTFGHGLSYSSFRYSDLVFSSKKLVKGGLIDVQLSVSNDGKYEGKEVVQMYLKYPKYAGEPPKVLRGFEKTEILKPGDSAKVKFSIAWDGPVVGVWNTTIASWSVIPGDFGVLIGSTSEDIRVNGTFVVYT